MGFISQLEKSWDVRNSLVCVGLDPLLNKMPQHIQDKRYPLLEFNKAIIDSTADLVCAFKPQIAYYASQRAEDQLEETIKYIHERYPDIPVILDAKRNDIGNTAEQYAIEAFDRYKADAVTVSPYMGTDSLKPFLEREDKGTILLCRTSNSVATDLQDLTIDGEPLYLVIARKAVTDWNGNKNISLVVGATYPKELQEIRKITGDIPFLIPGVGAQGGNVETSVCCGKNSNGSGLIISSSRAINYASSGDDFAEAARNVVNRMKIEINSFR